MSVFEVRGGRVNRRYLERKSKFDLCSMYLDLLNQFERVQPLAAENEKLWAAIKDVRDLIESSEGVAGLHENGDIAPWEDLLAGGEYELWLYRISDPLTDDELTVSLADPEDHS